MRGMSGLVLVRNDLNFFIVYSIDEVTIFCLLGHRVSWVSTRLLILGTCKICNINCSRLSLSSWALPSLFSLPDVHGAASDVNEKP